jgi:hypothetical protein
MFRRLKIWWLGVPPSIIETENGGWRIAYQDPDKPPARDRVKAALHTSFVRRAASMFAIPMLVAIVAAAISKWLGLLP